VNRDTRPNHPDAVPARLNGWHRCWGHRALINAHTRSEQTPGNDAIHAANHSGWTVLSVEHRGYKADLPGKSVGAVEGMIVTVDRTELPALDAREKGYKRLELARSDFEFMDTGDIESGHSSSTLADAVAETIYMYVSEEKNAAYACAEFPLLQSYVDCVMAGFESEFGSAGLQRFIDTTLGWSAPMLEDRSDPRYVRSVSLCAQQARRYDNLLAKCR